MRTGLLILSILFSSIVFSQDTLNTTAGEEALGTVTVIKDSRLDILAKKEAEFNDSKLLPNNLYAVKGYRLMLMSTNDRAMAMNVRSQLLQRYPEHKVYMSFQAPHLKLKFGNFMDKEEAEKYKKELIKSKLITTNIYLIPEMIEVKGELLKDKEKEKEKE
ncbi:MAG: SPOR domain-containing protein [Bacteroidota bacterium]